MPKISDIVPGYEWDEETDLKMYPAWFQDTPHCVPPWTPMFSWFWINWCHHGMQYGAEKLTIPTHKGLEWRHLRGGGVMGMAIIKDEEEIKRREPKFREMIRPYIENYDQIWKGYIDEMLAIYGELKKLDLDKASNLELKEHFEAVVNMYRRMWEIHWMILYPIDTCYALFEDLCSELLGIDDRSPEFLALLKGFDNKAFQIDKKMWEFSKEAIKLGLADIFVNNTAEDCVQKLKEREAGRKWSEGFQRFLLEDGWRMQRMAEINSPTWIEDPSVPIVNVQHFVKKGGDFDLDKKREEGAKEREKVTKTLMQKVKVEQRDWFQALMRVAQATGSISEEHAHYLDLYSHAMIRHCCIGIGKRLVQAGTIDQIDDIFFLNGDEVRMVMITPEFHDLRFIVHKRRQDWEGWCKQVNPFIIMKPGMSQQEAMGLLISSKDPSMMKIAIGRLPVAKPELKADLYGSGVSPGVAEGPARCIFDYSQLKEVKSGEILIAPATAPTWTMVFSLLKGVVVASGGSLAHAAIVGREYGIPVVVNVYDGIMKIKTGQKIRIDGNLGLVYFLE
jgi:phosphohistidine swiveling domain-containing protein